MASTDVAFSGSVPRIYDRYLADLLFRPYAEDLARRAAESKPGYILETAAGTGLATAAILNAVPGARLVATDLNQAMLDVAAERLGSSQVQLKPADAQSLPFEDASFDLVLCQFGMMFLPDRTAGFREARRVLKPGGRFIFSVWDRLEANPVASVVAEAVGALFADDPPSFFERVPWGYHDRARLERDVRSGGFADVAIDTIEKRSRAAAPHEAAVGLCQGTPLRAEIEGRGDLQLATAAAEDSLRRRFGAGPLDQPMSALLVTASG